MISRSAIPPTCAEAEPFALRVCDNSMAPEFWLGCVVTFDPNRRAKDGDYVLAELEDAFVLRKLRYAGATVQLEALDPTYPPNPLTEINCVRGVVVQRAGTRRRDHKRYDVSPKG